MIIILKPRCYFDNCPYVLPLVRQFFSVIFVLCLLKRVRDTFFRFIIVLGRIIVHFLDIWTLLIWTILCMIFKDNDTDKFKNSLNSVKVTSRKRKYHLTVDSCHIVIKNSIDFKWRKNNINLGMHNALLKWLSLCVSLGHGFKVMLE